MLFYGENETKTECAVLRIAHHFNIRDLSGDPACKTVLLINSPVAEQSQPGRPIWPYLRLRTRQREAERQAEHLFQTLLHRAFRGELQQSSISSTSI